MEMCSQFKGVISSFMLSFLICYLWQCCVFCLLY